MRTFLSKWQVIDIGFLYRNRAKQLINFDTLSSGKMHPTDIDAIIEYKNKAYILMEYKFKGRTVDLGQRLCLERMTNDFHKAGKKAVAIICEHEVEDTNQDVDAGGATIRALYTNQWLMPTRRITVAEFVEGYLKDYKIERSKQ